MYQRELEKYYEKLKNNELNQYSEKIYKDIKTRWDHIAKPLDSMGKFENVIARIGAIEETLEPKVEHNALVVFCADNGIVEEGISQSGQEVTASCANSISHYYSCAGVLAKSTNTEMYVMDIGMATTLDSEVIRNCKVRSGTRNFAKTPAMTEDEVKQAIYTGMKLAKEMKDSGYHLVAMGEMGIGNTTTSSAVAASVLKLPASVTTGRGAGLTDDKLQHKIDVIQNAINHYNLYELDPLEILRTVGGLDIAGMVGLCMGGAMYQVPIVLDGVISMTAALVACRLMPEAKDYLIASHISREPVAIHIIKELGLEPVLDANLALGEGSGALFMLSLIKSANEVYTNAITFEGISVGQYQRNE